MYKHTCKITLANGKKGEVTFDMPSTPDEWNGQVKGEGDDALGRVNELAVRSYVIAAQSGARKEKTLEAAQAYVAGYVFGEKGSPRATTVDAGLEWTDEQLKELAAQGIQLA